LSYSLHNKNEQNRKQEWAELFRQTTIEVKADKSVVVFIAGSFAAAVTTISSAALKTIRNCT
jgi:hypothetical protein